MSDSIGSLIDKLITNNTKLWFVQGKVHQAAQSGQGLDADTVAKLHALNLQRNALIAEIDEAIAKALSSGEVVAEPRIKLTD